MVGRTGRVLTLLMAGSLVLGGVLAGSLEPCGVQARRPSGIGLRPRLPHAGTQIQVVEGSSTSPWS